MCGYGGLSGASLRGEVYTERDATRLKIDAPVSKRVKCGTGVCAGAKGVADG